MNTLTREQSLVFFRDEAHRDAFIRHWKAHVGKTIYRADHRLLYAVLTGKDWRRGFAPVVNRNKVANGGWTDWRLWRVLLRLQHALHSERVLDALLAPFDGLVDRRMLVRVANIIPTIPLHIAKLESPFTVYPFDAYVPYIVERLSLAKEHTDAP